MNIKETIMNCVSTSVIKIEKHSPEILFGIGCIGVVATAVAAFKSYPKADYILDKHKCKMDDAKKAEQVAEPDSGYDIRVEKVRVCGETTKDMVIAMAPTVALGIGTIVSFGVAFKILNTRYLGAVAWGNAVAEAFVLYRGRVKDELGEYADQHFRYGTGARIVKNQYVTEDGTQVEEAAIEDVDSEDKPTTIGDLHSSDIARYFDESNDNWDPNPTFNLMFLRAKEKMATDKLNADGHLFLNDVYDSLGFKHTPIGAVVGWVKGDGAYVDFGLGNRDAEQVRRFINADRSVVPLDFNITGVIWDKI